jgi:hypothetical protein
MVDDASTVTINYDSFSRRSDDTDAWDESIPNLPLRGALSPCETYNASTESYLLTADLQLTSLLPTCSLHNLQDST